MQIVQNKVLRGRDSRFECLQFPDHGRDLRPEGFRILPGLPPRKNPASFPIKSTLEIWVFYILRVLDTQAPCNYTPFPKNRYFSFQPIRSQSKKRFIPRFRKEWIMRWIFLSVQVCACVLLVSAIGNPNQADAEEQPLSLRDCIDIALQHNPDIESAKKGKQEAGFKLEQAKSEKYPEIDAGANAGYISEMNRITQQDTTVQFGPSTATIPGREMELGAHEQTDLFLSLTQPVYTGGRIESGIRMAEAGFDAASNQIALEKTRIQNEVTTLFYQLAQSMENKKIAIISRDQIKSHLQDTQNLVDQGMLLQSDIHPVNIRRLDTELMIVKADNAISRTKAALAERLGFPPEKKIEITVDWDSAPPWPIPETLMEKNEERHEQRIAEKQIEAAAAEIDIAKGALLPEVGFTASGHYGYPGFNSTDPEWDEWWKAGIQVSYPIFDMNKKKHGEKAAVAKKARLAKVKKALDHRIALDQINSRLAYEEACRNLNITQEKVLAAEENYRLKNDNFKVGMATNTDFLDAHSELIKAKSELVLASAEMRITWSEFLRAMGKEDWMDTEKEKN